LGTIEVKQTICFQQNNQKYIFTVDKKLTSDERCKQIYVGAFCRNGQIPNESAPIGCELDRKYCIKKARIFFPLEEERLPQSRHFWDFFNFKGQNLRQVLAQNDDAKQMEEEIRSGALSPFEETEDKKFDCMVVEPLYKSVSDYEFPTAAEKIACILQIINGLKELMGQGPIADTKVIAHRDLKFRNVMVEEGEKGEKIMRLIDFPSIKLKYQDEEEDPDATVETVFSCNNTAPEDVVRGMARTSKIDVFALGLMLVEIFGIWSYKGTKNPLSVFFDVLDVGITSTPELSGRLREIHKQYKDDPILLPPNWLEQVLQSHEINANWSEVDNKCPEIRSLFRKATMFDPADRITLEGFEKELRAILKELPKEEKNGCPLEKVDFFLVDTTEFENCRTIYKTEAEKVMKDSGNLAWLFLYGSSSRFYPLCPSDYDLKAENVEVSAVEHVLSQMDSVPSHPARAYELSQLKGCLYELIGLMEHEAYEKAFSYNIHVFTPHLPLESRLCALEVICDCPDGTHCVERPSAAEICQKVGKSPLTVYVHTFKSDEKPENWFIPVYFPESAALDVPTQVESAFEAPESTEETGGSNDSGIEIIF